MCLRVPEGSKEACHAQTAPRCLARLPDSAAWLGSAARAHVGYACRVRRAMSFKRFVEIGRVGLVQYGSDEGKLCTVIDVIDNNRVLIDGPEPITGVKRQELNIKRLMLTDITVPCKLSQSQK